MLHRASPKKMSVSHWDSMRCLCQRQEADSPAVHLRPSRDQEDSGASPFFTYKRSQSGKSDWFLEKNHNILTLPKSSYMIHNILTLPPEETWGYGSPLTFRQDSDPGCHVRLPGLVRTAGDVARDQLSGDREMVGSIEWGSFTWRFPEMEVSPVIIHFKRIFHYKHLYHLWKPPHEWGILH